MNRVDKKVGGGWQKSSAFFWRCASGLETQTCRAIIRSPLLHECLKAATLNPDLNIICVIICFSCADWVLGLLWITGQLRVTESPDYRFPGYRVFHHLASFYRHIEVLFPDKEKKAISCIRNRTERCKRYMWPVRWFCGWWITQACEVRRRLQACRRLC